MKLDPLKKEDFLSHNYDVLFENFFPSIHQIEKLMGEREKENIYINGFNAVYINPLGWDKCQIRTKIKIREALF